MNNKLNYEEPKIEIIHLCSSDVITTSAPFDGEDDYTYEW